MAFPARFPGTCAQCDDEIRKGELIEYSDDDEVQHVLCPDGFNQVTGKALPVCGSCFITIPSGRSKCPECFSDE